MKKFIGTLLALAVAVANQATVAADHKYDPYSNNMGSAYSNNEGSAYTSEQSYHSGLAHRINDRQASHDQAHNLGLDNRQHNSLHQSMSHSAFHDSQDHANFDSNSSGRFNGSGYGTQSFGGSYPRQQRYSVSPYSVTPSYGNQYSTAPYPTRPYSGSQYSTPYLTQPNFGSQYSTSPYSMPRDMSYGNDSVSTIPRW